MSEQWDFYLCRVNDALSSIFVDLGVAAEAPQSERPLLLWIWLYLRDPREDGLSDSGEAPVLHDIEDALSLALRDPADARLVGRITTSGRREFYFYARKAEQFESSVASAMLEFPLYHFDVGVQDDPDWKHYCDVLYPSARNIQLIQNRHVLDGLEEHGDTLVKPREVYHWIYFRTEENRQAFAERVQQRGFKVDDMSEPDEMSKHRYGLSISREEKVDQNSIDRVTLDLFELANEMDGDYDGWETSVETEPNE